MMPRVRAMSLSTLHEQTTMIGNASEPLPGRCSDRLLHDVQQQYLIFRGKLRDVLLPKCQRELFGHADAIGRRQRVVSIFSGNLTAALGRRNGDGRLAQDFRQHGIVERAPEWIVDRLTRRPSQRATPALAAMRRRLG
jgi:hypothetical protein